VLYSRAYGWALFEGARCGMVVMLDFDIFGCCDYGCGCGID
jgi:hypothetical protein